ncbi:conserved hypothetical protein [Thermotomaculum hydrothermale]|uniref:Purine nucleoside phosphorylase n=1 Tax=Thermotomaculum hydrothermale TaxID=981385 RepID=A0A7R6PFZ4_9BACT|nr:polyphenol oxidase family protein [Thermotomaculum hydrothermale]BBB33033.1 conserved hypothetical protein [Thermotomaculum hydrothermale]
MKVMVFPVNERNILAGVSFKTEEKKIVLAEKIKDFVGFNDFSYLNQIHSGKVVEVNEPVKGIDGDALFTFEKGIMLSVFTADCVPVYIYSDNFAGIIHAGWRGFVNNIFENFFEEITKRGVNSKRLKAIIGVSICGNCYEVGEDVAKHFSEKFLKRGKNKFLLNLKLCAFNKLLSSGLKEESISISPYCTMHHNYFHSYRKNKTEFRNVNFIGIKGE